MSAVNTLRPGANPVLLGPSDPDHFRMQVGRYNDRHYYDPLEADVIAGATDAVWPSVSTVKKATGQDWSHVAVRRISVALGERPEVLAGLDDADRYSTLSMFNENGLRRAGDRGTNVHRAIEARLRGLSAVILPNQPGYEYLAAIEEFFDKYHPTLIAAEVVVIHRTLNGVGYGGTFDALIAINGRIYLVDWKSRDALSKHAAYPEEAAQVGAYAGGEYIIITDPLTGVARRAPMPRIDGGLIVSIRPDGCRLFPIDLGSAFRHWTALHAWWCARREERTSIGAAWSPVGVPLAAPETGEETGPASSVASVPSNRPEDVLSLKLRIGELIEAGYGPDLAGTWPSGVAPFSRSEEQTPEELSAILAAVRRVEDYRSLPFRAEDAPVAPVAPLAAVDVPGEVALIAVEGGEADRSAITALKRRTDAHDPEMAATVATIVAQANEAGLSVSLRALPSVRRFEIARAIVIAVEQTWCGDRADDQLIRAVIAHVTGDAEALRSQHTLGALFGALAPADASRVAEVAAAIGTDALSVVHELDGYHLSGSALSR